jgi:hypothetical protein
MTNTWAEGRYPKIRDYVCTQRRDARFSVEYNGDRPQAPPGSLRAGWRHLRSGGV